MEGRPLRGSRRTGGPFERALAAVLLAGIVAACGATPASPEAVAVPSVAAAPSVAAEPSGPEPTPRPDLMVVTIGDSIPFGQGDCGNCTTFTTLVADQLAADSGLTVASLNLSSHDGLTGAGLLERIRTSEPMRDAVADADVVVVNIGHNDTPWNAVDDGCDGDNSTEAWQAYTGHCVLSLADRHGTELDAILDEVEALRSGAPTAIRALTDYNDVIGWSEAPPDAIDPSVQVLDAFHAATCAAAAAHDLECVDVYRAFNGDDGRTAAGELLAGDYTHPSAAGQQRIAEVLLAAGFEELSLP